LYDADTLLDELQEDTGSHKDDELDLEDAEQQIDLDEEDEDPDLEDDDSELDSESEDAGEDFLSSDETESWSDDPVRMYLTQMGEIPLLTRQEEIALAKKIEITRAKFRRKVLECD
jgi:RNA polymerase primary sigma factor